MLAPVLPYSFTLIGCTLRCFSLEGHIYGRVHCDHVERWTFLPQRTAQYKGFSTVHCQLCRGLSSV